MINKDPITEDIQQILKEYLPPNTYCLHFPNKELEPVIIRIFQETFKNNSFKLFISNILLEDITDLDQQKEIIERYHTTKTSHRGITENIKNIKQIYYWPSLERDVINYVNTCEICQKTKYERHPYKIIYKPTPTGCKPFEHLYMDTYSILGQKFLTIIDNFSKFATAYPMNETSIEICQSLIKLFSHHGTPCKITTDNAKTFKSNLIQDLCKTYQIELHFTTPYNPNSNSPIERFHSTLKESLVALKNDHRTKTIQELVDIAILNYNNSIHSSHEYTPFQILKGNLNYQLNFEKNLNQIQTDYVHELAETFNTLNNEINLKLNAKKANVLSKLNEKRENDPEIPESTEQLLTTPNKLSKDLKPKYKSILFKNQRHPKDVKRQQL